MKLFISWSGMRSHGFSQVLKEWLPQVIQQIQPWISSEDIDKGQWWAPALRRELEHTQQGVICITPENMGAPWLNFEAGALMGAVDTSRVRPLLFDVAKSDITGPLAQFQATDATDAQDMRRLVESLNSACETPLTRTVLDRSFERNWTDYLGAVRAVGETVEAGAEVRRSGEDLLRETVDRIRDLQRVVEAQVLRDLKLGPMSLAALFRSGGTIFSGEPVSHKELGPAKFGSLTRGNDGAIAALITPDASDVEQLVDLADVVVVRRWGPVRPEEMPAGRTFEFMTAVDDGDRRSLPVQRVVVSGEPELD